MAGVAERLKSQVEAKTTRAQELERRILANHRAGNLDLAGTLARELQELKADLQTDTAGAEGDRGGLRRQPAAGQARAARVRGQGAAPGEAAVAGQDQGGAGRGRVGAVERGVQGRRSRRHDEARRGSAAEALRESRPARRGVAKDMVDMETVQEKENERKALEQVALAEFLASQGIQSTPAAGRRRRWRRKRSDLNDERHSRDSPRSASSSRSCSSPG